MAPILQQGLPKVGVMCIYPQALTHGPLNDGGLEIPQLYTEQLIAHVHMILQYEPDKEDPTGMLLHATGKAMRLELGYSRELLAVLLTLAVHITHS